MKARAELDIYFHAFLTSTIDGDKLSSCSGDLSREKVSSLIILLNA